MKLFWRETNDAWEDTDLNQLGTGGTVFHRHSNKDWRDFAEDVKGYKPGADAYIYVISLVRLQDDSRWFYVGKSDNGEEGVKARIQSHVNSFTTSRVIRSGGVEMILSTYAGSGESENTHRVVGVERLVPICFGDLDSDENWKKKNYVKEVERRTSYKVAIDHETTNVLGGK